MSHTDKLCFYAKFLTMLFIALFQPNSQEHTAFLQINRIAVDYIF